jgi:hypothetical protein
MRRFLTIPVVLLLLLAACGDDDDSAADGTTTTTEPATVEEDPRATPYVDVLADGLRDEGITMAEEPGRCLSRAIVEGIGVDQLEREDVSPQELVEAGDFEALGLEVGSEQVDRLAGNLEACDLTEFISLIVQSGAGVGMSGEKAGCVAEEIDYDRFRPGMAAAFLGEDAERYEGAFAESLAGGIAGCPEVLVALVAAGIEESKGDEMSDAGRACLAEELDPDEAEPTLVALFEGDQSALEELIAGAVSACPELVTELMVAGMEETLGEELSEEARACVAEQVEADPDAVDAIFRPDEDETVEAFQDRARTECGQHFGG